MVHIICVGNLSARVRFGREEVELEIDGFQFRVCVLMPWALPFPVLSPFNPFAPLPYLESVHHPPASHVMDHPTADLDLKNMRICLFCVSFKLRVVEGLVLTSKMRLCSGLNLILRPGSGMTNKKLSPAIRLFYKTPAVLLISGFNTVRSNIRMF
jgi:hypothetical protein